MVELEQTTLPGFEYVEEEVENLPPPPLWVVELLRLSLPFGVDAVLTFTVVQSSQRREGEGAVR